MPPTDKPHRGPGAHDTPASLIEEVRPDPPALSAFEGTVAGLRATVTYDEDASNFSPRDWHNAWRLLGFESSGRRFGDEQIDLAHLIEMAPNDFDLGAYLRDDHDAHLIAPVSFYEHGLVGYYAGTHADEWDCGAAGAAILTKGRLDSEFDGDRERARGALDCELETYTDWCNGSVYAVAVEDAAGAVLDSLGDVYGLEHAEAEAKAMLGVAVRDWLDERAARRYWAERDVETIGGL